MGEAGPHKPVPSRDPIFGRETVFAGTRNRRPHQAGGKSSDQPAQDCPFCPGNERYLLAITWHLDRGGAWQTRAVPNRYPIVTPPAGYHEIIVDSPRHPLPTPAMTEQDWRDLLTSYRARYRSLAAEWPYVTLFRNVGEHAGASIGHPHSQLIAMARTPAAVTAMRTRLRRSFRKTGRCPLCDQLRRAGDTGERLVAESGGFAVLVPEVPEVSFEVWVVPRSHNSLFALTDAETGALAGSLHDLFGRMGRVLGDFDHNMVLQGDGRRQRPHLHWFFRIRPKLEIRGGFELATGMSVNATRPDEDAAALRAANPSPQP